MDHLIFGLMKMYSAVSIGKNFEICISPPDNASSYRGISQQPFMIYTDGSCLKNPGPGGWAFLILKKGDIRYSYYQ